MRLPHLATVVAAGPLLTSCLISTETYNPSIELETAALSQFNHRGMVQNDEGVAQFTGRTTLPSRWEDGRFHARVMGNMDLSNDTGDEAWFPDGHAGEFTETDFELGYTHRLSERFDLTVGTISYVLHNGQEFITDSPAFSERGETKELFAALSAKAGPVNPFLQGNWDYDEVEGFYGRLGLASNSYALAESLTFDGDVAVGYSDEDHAVWTYGEAPGFDSAFVDLLARLHLTYRLDTENTLALTLGYASIIDDDQEDWFEVLGIEPDNVFLGFAWNWSFGSFR